MSEGGATSSRTWRLPGTGGNARLFVMGDCCYVGRDSRLLVSEFSVGDDAVPHNHLLANGDSELTMGNNAWVGQNGILNANQPLKIGNSVGIGAYSAAWTYGKLGALIDGCLMQRRPRSPGRNLGNNSLELSHPMHLRRQHGLRAVRQ